MAGDVSVPVLISDASAGGPPFEARPAAEAAAIQAVVAGIQGRVRMAATGGPAHRDAHPKAHGCVKAEFRVLDGLPRDLAAGLFAGPASYPAWVRFSNGSETPQADATGDGRGMAIKVMGVTGSVCGTQDFVLLNAPAFFVRDAADYVDFQTASNPLAFFFPGLNPFKFRLHELLKALAISRQAVSNPLNIRYWSMTPFLCGDIACKFSVRPVAPFSSFEDRGDLNFLRLNLVKSLAEAEAAFEFCVQRRTRPAEMPIEDPTIVWSETKSPPVPVARLTILRQGLDFAERDAFGENLSFSPWHGLEAHRPLGGINRIRRTVYEAVSHLRHDLNGETRVEPAGFQVADPSGL